MGILIGSAAVVVAIICASVASAPRPLQAQCVSTARYPILTVSDFEDFAVIGGVANFFIDGGRMRFKVNPDAAERHRLRISSNLLTLARVVRDAPTAR